MHSSPPALSSPPAEPKRANNGMNILLRPAAPADANAAADVYLASRKAFIAFAPLVHSDAEVRQWITHLLIPSGGVTVAVGDDVVGLMATSREAGYGWVDHLYVAPAFVGAGIGSRLLAQAKSELGSPIRLYTFQANKGARRFYERHGFKAIAFSDGQNNEEHCSDLLYQWVAAD